MFVQKNSFLQEEVLSLTEQIKDVEPKLMKLEPEYTRLAEEKNMWTSQKETTAKDLQGYKVIISTLQELNNSLQSLSANDELSEQSKEYSLSQQHVMWCGIPSLRRLSPLLYDQIRGMFQDLRQLEKELNNCRDTYEVEVDDLKVNLKKKTNELEQRALLADESKNQLERVTHRLHECEVELHEKRELCVILDNIRIVLKSSASVGIHKSGQSAMKKMNSSSSSNSAVHARFNPHLEEYDDGLQQPIDELNLQDLSEQFIVGETSSSPDNNQSHEQV